MTRPGELKLKHLFKPGRIGKFTTKNMIKYGACCVSNYNTRDGFITPRELARTRVIAGTGCGIITNQGAYPDPLGEGKAYFRQVALFDDKFLPQFETIAQYIHDGGAVAIQPPGTVPASPVESGPNAIWYVHAAGQKPRPKGIAPCAVSSVRDRSTPLPTGTSTSSAAPPASTTRWWWPS